MRVSLAEVADSTLRLLSPLAEKLGVTLACTPDESCVITAPEDECTRSSLTSRENAVKYNVEGGSRTSPCAGRTAQFLTVEDRGIGYRRPTCPTSSRASPRDKARSRERGGSGLGLSIVHDAVAALGGSIEVAAREGGRHALHRQLPGAGGGRAANLRLRDWLRLSSPCAWRWAWRAVRRDHRGDGLAQRGGLRCPAGDETPRPRDGAHNGAVAAFNPHAGRAGLERAAPEGADILGWRLEGSS